MKRLIAFLERWRLLEFEAKLTGASTEKHQRQFPLGKVFRRHALLWACLFAVYAWTIYPGCALLINGVTEPVHVRSSPDRARVYVDGKLVGEAPIKLNLARIHGHLLRVELDGFSPVEIPLKVGSAEAFSFPGMLLDPFLVIDLPSGAVFALNPPKSAFDPKPEPTEYWQISVLATLHPTGDLRKIGQMQRRKLKE